MNATTEMMDPGSLRVWSAIRIRVRFGRTVVRATIAPVVLAFAACTASPTTATLINVDFNSSGPGTSVGTFSGTGVLGGGTWNGVAVNQNAQALASTALLDSAGAASGISVAIPAYQGAWNLADQPASSWKPLLGDWVYLTAAGQSSATIILSGLGSSTAWDLVFYAANGIGEGSDFTIGAFRSYKGCEIIIHNITACPPAEQSRFQKAKSVISHLIIGDKHWTCSRPSAIFVVGRNIQIDALTRIRLIRDTCQHPIVVIQATRRNSIQPSFFHEAF